MPVPALIYPPIAPPAVRVAGCPFRVSLVLSCCYAIPGGLRVLRAWSSRPFHLGF